MISVKRGSVNTAEEHFRLLCRQDEDCDDWTAAVLVGLSGEGDIKFQRLADPRLTSEMKDQAMQELYYYLVKMPEGWGSYQTDELWDYMRYHARHTAANLYGNVRWLWQAARGSARC